MPDMALYIPGQQNAMMLVWKIWNHALVWGCQLVHPGINRAQLELGSWADTFPRRKMMPMTTTMMVLQGDGDAMMMW
jgi:hypothetical protein